MHCISSLAHTFTARSPGPWIRWNNENLVGLAAFTLFQVRDLDQVLCPACAPLWKICAPCAPLRGTFQSFVDLAAEFWYLLSRGDSLSRVDSWNSWNLCVFDRENEWCHQSYKKTVYWRCGRCLCPACAPLVPCFENMCPASGHI